MLAFALVWLGHLQSVALTVPMDNVEQWVWSLSLQWGYHKHPPLPTWMLWLAHQMVGRSPWTAVILGAACSLGSIALMYALVRRVWSHSAAWLAVLAALSITFYSGRLNYYNHNITLMVCVSLTVYCWWQILQNAQTRWWVLLGLSAGLGMLSKYQYLLVLPPSLVCLVWLRPWRSRQLMWQLVLCLLLAAVLFAPHVLWLLERSVSDGPIAYALKTSKPTWLGGSDKAGALLHSGLWLLDLVFNRCLPALLVLLAVKAWGHRAESAAAAPSFWAGWQRVNAEKFLLLWGLLPAMTITALGIVLGMDLQMQWGTAFALWLVPALMVLLNIHRLPLSSRTVRVSLGAFALLQMLLLLQSYSTSAAGCCTNGHWRNFDSAQLARELEIAARPQIGGQFHVLVGSANSIGAVAMALPERPPVLIDGRLDISPWVSMDELFGAGVVQMFAPGALPEGASRLPSGWSWRVFTPDDLPNP